MANKKKRTGLELRSYTMDLASKFLDALKQLPVSEASTMLDTVSEELEIYQNAGSVDEVPLSSKGGKKK